MPPEWSAMTGARARSKADIVIKYIILLPKMYYITWFSDNAMLWVSLEILQVMRSA